MPSNLKNAIQVFIIFLIVMANLSTDEPFDCADFQCWDGITLGETTHEVASRIFTLRYGKWNVIDSPRTITLRYPKNVVGSIGDEATITVFFNDQEIVDWIQVYFDVPYPSLDEIITTYGEPSFVYLVTSPCTVANIAYQEQGANALLITQQSFVDVEPYQPVSVIYLLSTDPAPPEESDTYISAQPWQGYVDYCEVLTRDQ